MFVIKLATQFMNALLAAIKCQAVVGPAGFRTIFLAPDAAATCYHPQQGFILFETLQPSTTTDVMKMLFSVLSAENTDLRNELYTRHLRAAGKTELEIAQILGNDQSKLTDEK